MQKREINKKTVHIQFVCMIFVIFVHTYNVNVYGLTELGLSAKGLIVFQNLISNILGNHIAVPLFMMIAGFHFFRNTNGQSDILPKMKRRVKTLVVPYLFWNAVGCVYFLFISRLPFISAIMNGQPDPITISNMLQGLFLYKYYFPFWFLCRLICYVILSYPIYMVLRDIRYAIPLIIGLAIVWISDVPLDEYTVSSALFYLMGATLTLHFPHVIEQSVERNTAYIYLCVLCIFSGLLLVSGISWMNRLVYIFLPFVFWKATDIWSLKTVKTHRYEHLSFYLYCAHILILETIEKIIGRVWGTTLIGAWIDYLLAPAVTVAILFLIYEVIYKLMPRFTRLICGGRVG